MSRTVPADGEAVVLARIETSPDVVVLELGGVDGAPLPSWEPGAHIDALLPSGLVRQYSLCGEPGQATWRIAVLREPAGRGGSLWLSDRLNVGQRLRFAGPRNHFRFHGDATGPVLLVAGGIGITPLVPMAATAAGAGLDYTIHYSAPTRAALALLAELRERHGERLVTHVSDEGSRLDVASLVGAADSGTVVYCCGPAGLLDEVESACHTAGLVLHEERFVASGLTAPVWTEPFEVELAASGYSVTVPPDRSVLDVVESSGALVLSSCHEGTCGTCETVVLQGEIDHRDSILTPSERARGDVMYVCVSRAAGPRIVLDL